MSRFAAFRAVPLILLVLAPVAILAGMVATGRLDGHGRDYVIRLDLPAAGARLGLPPVQGPLDASRPLVVAGDKAVRYEEITKVVGALQNNGFTRIGLLVEQTGQNGKPAR